MVTPASDGASGATWGYWYRGSDASPCDLLAGGTGEEVPLQR